MEPWRTAWREVAPYLRAGGLEALREALAVDNPHLITGSYQTPPPLECVADWPVDGACPVSFALWKGENFTTVTELHRATVRLEEYVCKATDDPRATRPFVEWVDTVPRAEMLAELLPEVDRELARRAAAAVA